MWKRSFGLVLSILVFTVSTATPSEATASVDWVRQVGTASDDFSLGVSIDSTGASYVASFSYGELPGQTDRGDGDAALHAIDAVGNVTWVRQFGTRREDIAVQTAVDATGVYVLGTTEGKLGPSSTRTGDDDAFLRKYSLTGDQLWTVQFGTRRADRADDLVIDGSNAYVLGDTFGQFPGFDRRGYGGDIFLAALDLDDGSIAWARQFGTRRGENSWGVAIDASGLYTIGGTDGTFPGQRRRGDGDIVVHRFTTDGTRTWVRQFGTTQTDGGFGIAVGPEGLFVGGTTEGEFRGYQHTPAWDPWVRRMGKNTGAPIWTKQFRRAGTVSDIVLDGSMLAIGTTSRKLDGQTTGADAFVRSMSVGDGAREWTEIIGTRRSDYAESAAMNGRTLVIAGSTDGRFPGEERFGEFDIFAAHVTVT